jgi:hypothetical protein
MVGTFCNRTACRIRNRRRRHDNNMDLRKKRTPRASRHYVGWRAGQKSLLLPVAGECFLLTLPFIERRYRMLSRSNVQIPPKLLATILALDRQFLVYRSSQLLQFRVLRLGLLQDADVGIGVFPEREEILVGRTGLRGVAGEGDCAGKTQPGERT